MRRGLFITHDVSNYGASRSLQFLLRNYDRYPVDLVVLRYVFRNLGDTELRNRFGKHLGTINRFFLPYELCVHVAPGNPVELFLAKWYLRLLWLVGENSLRSFIKNRRPGFIHLNSLVLYPLITEEEPYIIHVREMAEGSKRDIRLALQKARGVIFIDEATREPFRDLELRHSIVLNNPIDMKPLSGYPIPDLHHFYIDVERDTIFAVIGKIAENKGIDFIIRSFMATKNPRARLLIVGEGKGALDYKAKCRNMAAEDPRVIFWGEEPDIYRIYRFTDYILRGEDRPCIGRTIYEGLYAGCGVIIPVHEGGEKDVFEYQRYKEKIYGYPPRDETSLREVLDDLVIKKADGRVFRSNVDEYVERFHEFVMTSIS